MFLHRDFDGLVVVACGSLGPTGVGFERVKITALAPLAAHVPPEEGAPAERTVRHQGEVDELAHRLPAQAGVKPCRRPVRHRVQHQQPAAHGAGLNLYLDHQRPRRAQPPRSPVYKHLRDIGPMRLVGLPGRDQLDDAEYPPVVLGGQDGTPVAGFRLAAPEVDGLVQRQVGHEARRCAAHRAVEQHLAQGGRGGDGLVERQASDTIGLVHGPGD